MAGLFQVLWGLPGGKFKRAAVLNGTDGEPLVIPSTGGASDIESILESIATRPTAVDWDCDGDFDLVVGNFAGSFYLFTGEGQGKFAPTPRKIESEGRPLKVQGMHSDPFLVDWDGDGDLDLLSGSGVGGVWWAENTAGPKKTPVLKPFQELIAGPSPPRSEFRPGEVTAPANSTRVWATDLNADGKLDIVVGDCITLISPAEGVSETDFTRRYGEWNEANAALQQETIGITDEAKLEPIYDRKRRLSEQRKEFMNEDRTGFVWLYLQK